MSRRFHLCRETLGLFSTVLVEVGVALCCLSLVNAGLIGADRPAAILLASLPTIGAVVVFLIGSHAHGSIVAFYLMGVHHF